MPLPLPRASVLSVESQPLSLFRFRAFHCAGECTSLVSSPPLSSFTVSFLPRAGRSGGSLLREAGGRGRWRIVRRGGAPLPGALPACSPSLPFPGFNGLIRAPRDGEQRPMPVSVWFRPFRDSLGPPHGQRACSAETVRDAHPWHPPGGSLCRGPG